MLIRLVIAAAIFASMAPQLAAKNAVVRNFLLPHDPSSLLIKFKDPKNKVRKEQLLQRFGGVVTHTFTSSQADVVKFARLRKNRTVAEIAHVLSQQGNVVEYVEANSIVRADKLPDDPKLPELYGMNNTGQGGGAADADIDAPEAWDVTTGSKKVVVAIIDTGFNYLHPDLAPNAYTNPGESGTDSSGADKTTNGIDDDGNGFVDDFRGWDFVNNDNDPMDDNGYSHGSHCGGTIGGHGNDGFGVVGVSWDVSMLGVKFLNAAGSGNLEDAIKSIEYATLLKVDIMNNSWGGGGFSQPMFDAIEASNAKNILFVAAAGNSGVDADLNPHYPSSYTNDNIVSVAATDKSDTLASFSNFGITTVDLSAPGVDIISAGEDDTFRSLSGTSMATPHVAGAAALIKTLYPNIPVAQVRTRLLNGVDRIEKLRGVVASGGRMNVANSLENDNIAPGAVPEIKVSGQDRRSVNFTWTGAGDDGDAGTASSYELRYAARPIVTEDDWNEASASTAYGFYSAKATEYNGSISNLPFNYEGYAAIRAYDNVGNKSPLSKSIPIAVTQVKIIAEHRAENLDGVTVTGTWALEDKPDGKGKVFSDSPAAWYIDNTETSVTFDPIVIDTNNIALVYQSKTELEKGYDFGYVDVSADRGVTWTQVDLLTGAKAWQTRLIDLEPILGASSVIQFRFRLKTDYVIQADGWYIDDVLLIADK
jgi:subtilisin family serine protease